MSFSGLFRSEDKKVFFLNEQYMYIVLILQSKKKNSQILLKRAEISVIPIILKGVLCHVCAILLVYYRSPCMNQIQEKYYLYTS